MSISEIQFRKACLSNVLHDLVTIKACAGYHALNKFNPYSVKFSAQFHSLLHQADLLYREINEFSVSVVSSED